MDKMQATEILAYKMLVEQHTTLGKGFFYLSSTCFEVKEKKTALVKSPEKISLNCFIDLFTT